MLTRWDPFREMVSMRRAVDRLMENSLGEEWDQQSREWSLALDVVENEDSYLIRATVPGVKPEDLEITFNKGMLTIRGELKDESEKTQGQYHLRERRYGAFSRSVTLPANVKADDIQADYLDGILTLTLPKAEEAKPKRIQIGARSHDGQPAIEGKSRNN